MIKVVLSIIIYISIVFSSFAQVKSKDILIKNDSILLPGTLTYTKEKAPLLIWVHGSGNIDRNGNQEPMIKANYIKQFRDSINKNDIAFFSYDKRTANKNNMPILLKGVDFIDYVSDLKKVIKHFKNDNRFSKIILVGHSQGSLVAMLASENIDKFISIAGPNTSADKAIIKQIQEKAPFLDSITKAHFKELKETGKVENVNPMLVSVFAKQNQSFVKSWIQYNPEEEIKKITVPILIINGTEDLQVKPTDASSLLLANDTAQLTVIKGMNHVLKEVKTMLENQTSYLKPDFPLSNKLIEVVTNFVKK